jgi:hypothetical protein
MVLFPSCLCPAVDEYGFPEGITTTMHGVVVTPADAFER